MSLTTTAALEKLFQLPPFNRLKWHLNADLTAFSTLRLQSKGHLVQVSDHQVLSQLILRLNDAQIPYRLLGWGANMVMPPIATDQLFIQLLKPREVSESQVPFDPEALQSGPQAHYDLSAATALSELIRHAKQHGNSGWQALTGIPASLGGAIFMNAGTKFGAINQLLSNIYILTPQGQWREHQVKAESFSYRQQHVLAPGEIIIGARLTQSHFDPVQVEQDIREYLDYRKKTQPMGSYNCGCVFKNPAAGSAGQLIDRAGLKGFRLGPMEVSNVHANFFNNLGGATRDDFFALVELVRTKVAQQSGITLEQEVQW